MTAVEFRGRCEGIDKDEGGLGGVVGVRHLVASCGPEVGDLDGLGVRHGERCRNLDCYQLFNESTCMSGRDENEDLRRIKKRAII